MIVHTMIRAIAHRQRCERTGTSATTSASHTFSNTPTDAIGDAVMIYKAIFNSSSGVAQSREILLSTDAVQRLRIMHITQKL